MEMTRNHYARTQSAGSMSDSLYSWRTVCYPYYSETYEMWGVIFTFYMLRVIISWELALWPTDSASPKGYVANLTAQMPVYAKFSSIYRKNLWLNTWYLESDCSLSPKSVKVTSTDPSSFEPKGQYGETSPICGCIRFSFFSFSFFYDYYLYLIHFVTCIPAPRIHACNVIYQRVNKKVSKSFNFESFRLQFLFVHSITRPFFSSCSLISQTSRYISQLKFERGNNKINTDIASAFREF